MILRIVLPVIVFLFGLSIVDAEEPRPAAIKDEAKWKALQSGVPVLLMRDDDKGDGGTKRTLAGIIIASVVGGWILKMTGKDEPTEPTRTVRLEITAPKDDHTE